MRVSVASVCRGSRGIFTQPRRNEAPLDPRELRVKGEDEGDGERLHETEEAAHAQMRAALEETKAKLVEWERVRAEAYGDDVKASSSDALSLSIISIPCNLSWRREFTVDPNLPV
ncbi:hypothetical protein B0H14DRAFT_3517078 [Mycena olivaceomarginata]|nr:hypothetical protein B0H14DRAFT_3517078 [Mycena olivaceomarginata]